MSHMVFYNSKPHFCKECEILNQNLVYSVKYLYLFFFFCFGNGTPFFFFFLAKQTVEPWLELFCENNFQLVVVKYWKILKGTSATLRTLQALSFTFGCRPAAFWFTARVDLNGWILVCFRFRFCMVLTDYPCLQHHCKKCIFTYSSSDWIKWETRANDHLKDILVTAQCLTSVAVTAVTVWCIGHIAQCTFVKKYVFVITHYTNF